MSRIAPAAAAATTIVNGGIEPASSPSEVESEEARREMDAHHLELLHELRTDAGRLQPALDLAFDDARLLEHEDVLHDDDVAFHALDLGDVRDLPGPVLEAALVDDEVHGRGDLLADGPQGQVDAGHEDHRLEAREHVARTVGVTGGHRAVMARVHGLEHVEGLARTALADDDAVGPHAQGVPHELADGDGAPTLDVRRPRLERDDVLLAELELGGVLDRDDPLVVRDEGREDIERRRLARAGAARHEDVQARFDAGLEEVEHLRGGSPEPDEVVDGERAGRELPDRDDRTDERQGRDDRVDAGAVCQAGVDHRAPLVHAPTDRGDDPIDDPHHVVVVLEDHVRELELARALDVHLARAVHHDFGDALVAEERLERSEADDLVRDLLEHPDALGAGEGEPFLVDDLAEDLLDLTTHLDLVRQVELGVEVLDDPVLDAELNVPERFPNGPRGHEPRRGRDRRTATGRSWHPGSARRSREAWCRRRARPRSGALDPLEKGHRLHPLSPCRADCYRHANSDLFFAVFRPSSVTAVSLASPAIDAASRRMSWET